MRFLFVIIYQVLRCFLSMKKNFQSSSEDMFGDLGERQRERARESEGERNVDAREKHRTLAALLPVQALTGTNMQRFWCTDAAPAN